MHIETEYKLSKAKTTKKNKKTLNRNIFPIKHEEIKSKLVSKKKLNQAMFNMFESKE